MFPALMPRFRPHKLAWAAPQSSRAAQRAVSSLAIAEERTQAQAPGQEGLVRGERRIGGGEGARCVAGPPRRRAAWDDSAAGWSWVT